MGVNRRSSQAFRATSSEPSSTTSVVSIELRITPFIAALGTGLQAERFDPPTDRAGDASNRYYDSDEKNEKV